MFISSILCEDLLINDEQMIHSMLTNCFDSNREKYNVLYKKNYSELENGELKMNLLVYSDVQPVSTNELKVIQSMYVEPEKVINTGKAFRFNVIANPVRTTKGKKHPITNKNERIDWLKMKFESNGAEIIFNSCDEIRVAPIHMIHSYGKGTITAYQYSGILRITDSEKFIELFHKGLGRGKAYGCGLIQLGAC